MLVAAGTAALGLALRVYVPLFWSHDFLPLPYLHSMGFFRTYSLGQFFLTGIWPYWNAALAGLWTFLILLVGGRRLLGPSRPPAAPGPRRSRLRVACTIGLLVVSLPSVALGTWGLANEVRAGGRSEIEDVCNRCHTFERPLAFIRSPEAWRITVDRMQGKIPGLITDQEKEQVLSYLLATRSWTGEQLFDIKCQQACHDTWLRDQQREAEEWQRIVRRIRLKNPFFITQMQEREILAYIETAGLAVESGETAADYAEQRIYEEACVECHTLDIILAPESRDLAWDSVLDRMHEKAPWLYSKEEVLGLQPWIERMQDDPLEFARSVPHLTRDIIYGATTADVSYETNRDTN